MSGYIVFNYVPMANFNNTGGIALWHLLFSLE